MRQAGTILVVEDNPRLLEMTARMLRTGGYTVYEAISAAEAIAIHRAHPGEIDLILTDVRMPLLNGTDLADRVRAGDPGMPFLFMSGDREGSPPGVLLKPFRMAQLWDAVANSLAQIAAKDRTIRAAATAARAASASGHFS